MRRCGGCLMDSTQSCRFVSQNSVLAFVMPALVAGIHVFLFCVQDVDGRDKPGHDD
jgi:hypothetical protein